MKQRPRNTALSSLGKSDLPCLSSDTSRVESLKPSNCSVSAVCTCVRKNEESRKQGNRIYGDMLTDVLDLSVSLRSDDRSVDEKGNELREKKGFIKQQRARVSVRGSV